MERIVAYVDGLNLYHGMRDQFGRAYHWLDVQALVVALLRPDQRLEAVRYFTARVGEEGPARLRQRAYLEALDAQCPLLTTHEGRFQARRRGCRICGAEWIAYEEKETDVNLASALVEDASLNRLDRAFLVSADGDLCPAIRSARRIQPEARFVAVFPPKRHSDALRRTADGVLWIGRDKLKRSQLPAKVVTPAGIELARPAYWN